jgi:hypothetical protein
VLQPAFSKIELKWGREIWINSWLPKQEICGFADYLPGNYYFLDAWCCCWRVRNNILSNPWSWGTSRFRKLTGATRLDMLTKNLRIAPRCCGWRARESSVNLFMRAGALDVLKSNHDQLLPRCYSQVWKSLEIRYMNARLCVPGNLLYAEHMLWLSCPK